ncbi:MAG: ABC transporter permease, partial [Armatimonadetes bacterium]|nr:ABC transporter permease [Armatimonadota bacterium]
MDILEAFAVATEALRAHKLRSFLTMLGVIIGVAAVIALVSVGQTVRSSVVGEFAELGPDLLWVFPGKAKEGTPVSTQEGRLTLTYDDARAISRGAGSVSDVTPFLQTSIAVAAAGEKTTTTVIGTTPNLLTVRSLRLQVGRFLQQGDLAGRKRVAVIGQTLA